ncbi:MAG: hypothetical protein KatS3mg078_0692 [Deltaproteobacteria bacterium]|nr:MAG: hypothetical protein KatS3mg078_0692 [Deltaproteobacteria bacterium]
MKPFTVVILFLCSILTTKLLGCTKKIEVKLPQIEINSEDRFPIRVGVFMDQSSRDYTYKSEGRLFVGRAVRDFVLVCFKSLFSDVKEVEKQEISSHLTEGIFRVDILAFYMLRRGFSLDSYIVLQVDFLDKNGNKIWQDLILGEGTSGVFWGSKTESARNSIVDAMLKLKYKVRRSSEIRYFVAKQLVSGR